MMLLPVASFAKRGTGNAPQNLLLGDQWSYTNACPKPVTTQQRQSPAKTESSVNLNCSAYWCTSTETEADITWISCLKNLQDDTIE